MELLLILLGLYLLIALLVVPIWAFVRIRGLDHTIDALQARLRELHMEVEDLRSARPEASQDARPSAPAATPVTASVAPMVVAPPPPAVPAPEPAPIVPPIIESVTPIAPPPPPPVAEPPPLLIAGAAAFQPGAEPSSDEPVVTQPAVSAAFAPGRPVYTPPPPEPGLMENINWEQFMGAKLFAWLGGLALFLGVAFFVKYSFDHGWIPPEVRVALGFLTGAGLVIGGLKIDRERYRHTAQALIASGVVSLYAVTFACNSVYHFAFFGTVPTFLLMALITTAAFVLSVRLPAQAVAILGMLGGFLTPILLSTGVDNPGGLFGYLALLDIGLVAVALFTGWRHLVPLSAGGTVLMMIGWSDKFFTAAKGPVAMTICLTFTALYLAAAALARRRELSSRAFSLTAAALPFVGFVFALFFLDYAPLAVRAPLYLGFVLLLDVALLSLAWKDEFLPRIHVAAGLVAFTLLGLWTARHLTDDLLPWALAFYLGFGALHAVFPVWLERERPEFAGSGWSQLFAPLTLLLLLLPIGRLDQVSFLIWPAILLVDLIAIGLAVVSASLVSVVVVLVLTLFATALSLFKVPAALGLPFPLLLVIGGFAVFFFAAGFWLVRKLGDRLPAGSTDDSAKALADARAQLPAFASLMPFLLLILACARLAVPDPSMIFGLALLLVVLTLGLALILTRSTPAEKAGSRQTAIDWLPLCALVGLGGLEFAWHARHFSAAAPTVPLLWYGGFLLLFAAYPFVFRRDFATRTGPWAVAALAGILQFPLVHRVVALAFPNEVMGLLPALFAVVPLLSLVGILKSVPESEPARLNQLAWFGGTALFFITLIFPLQFDRQWITIGWALEGAALLWLFHRVPHPGLRATGVALLAVAFVRLTFNGAVFSYHVRGDTPILNWYLYAYGLVIAALFVGAKLLAPPRERTLGIDAPPLLNTLGVILAFILLNIEIADFYTAPGTRTLAFRFRGSLPRDMTYTIAWALFALGLLGVGLLKSLKGARYAAIGLLGVALAKLFLHDLAHLQALYRVGALMAVAVIAILASFAYQRFLPAHEKTAPTTP